MTYLAILRDNMTGLNYAFASDSIPQIEKASFDCIENEGGFFKESLEIRDYDTTDLIPDESINSTGSYIICHKDFKYESFHLVIYAPDAFKLI